MNFVLYILSILIIIKSVLCEYGLSKTNVTLDSIKKLELKLCQNDNDCPELYNNCYIPPGKASGYCNMFLFCHETGDCLKLSLGEFELEFRYRWQYYKTESYDYYYISMNSCNLGVLNEFRKDNMTEFGDIRDSTEDWGFFEDCKRSTCSKNDECFSKKCNTNEQICDINESKPAYVCTLNKNEYNRYRQDCLLMLHEKCSHNSDCLSDVCDSNTSICVNKDSKLNFSELVIYYFKMYYLVGLGIFFLILIAISVIARIRKAKIKSKEVVFARMEY